MKVDIIDFPNVFQCISFIAQEQNVEYISSFEVNKKTFDFIKAAETKLPKLPEKDLYDFCCGTEEEMKSMYEKHGLKQFSDFLDDAWERKYSVFKFHKAA